MCCCSAWWLGPGIGGGSVTRAGACERWHWTCYRTLSCRTATACATAATPADAVLLASTTAGTVGFVGLVTPHLVRLAVGADHRFVVPASALAGGTLLVAADTIARTLMAPRQLPVGAITAIVGVPLFLLLLSRGRKGDADQARI